MYAEPFFTPSRATDAQNKAIGSARWFFYQSGTTTPQAVYTSPALTTAHANPVVADNAGIFPPIYFDPAKTYRVILKSATGNTTLQDIDPANPNDVFVQAAGGAVARGVADKLRDAPFDVADFGTVHPDGSVNDTAVFQAAFNAAQSAGRNLRLPAGTFAVSGLVFNGTIAVTGAGPANTVFVPTADGQTVVTLMDHLATYLDRGKKAHFADFAIDLSGTLGCTGLKTAFLIRTVIERIRVIGSDAGAYNAGAIGWLSYADQFSTFRDIYVERCERGFVMTNDETAGSGNNNHFDGLHVAYCRVNAMIYHKQPYPMHTNHFTNLRLQASQHCGLFLSEVAGFYFSMLTPEDDTASQASLVYDGQTVKRGTIHATRSSARFDGYGHAQASSDMPITAENGSTLTFDVSLGAAIHTVADASSTIDWHGHWGNNSVFANTRVSLQANGSYASVLAWHPADSAVSSAVPNEVVWPMAVPVLQHFNCTSALCADPVTGIAREVAYLAQAGGQTSNCISLATSAASYEPDDEIWCSVLLMSDRDTTIAFGLAEMTASGTVDLKAGQWTRVFTGNFNISGLQRLPLVSFWPTAGDQPVLRIARPVAARNLTAQQVRMLSERHLFSPRDPLGCVLRLGAAPTTGKWEAGASVVNASPAPGAPMGWTCTSAGTPGTWKAMPALAV